MGATEGHARVSNTQTLQAVVFIAYIAMSGSFVLCTAGVFQTTNCSSVQCVPISSALGQSYPLLLQSRVICIICLFVCVREDLLEHRYLKMPKRGRYLLSYGDDKYEYSDKDKMFQEESVKLYRRKCPVSQDKDIGNGNGKGKDFKDIKYDTHASSVYHQRIISTSSLPYQYFKLRWRTKNYKF